MSSLSNFVPSKCQEEIKRLEIKIGSQEDKMVHRITMTITKHVSTHMERLYVQYAQDLSTYVSFIINERTNFKQICFNYQE